jgi:aryl-alcohol dehydrogenase-like predicted oxidoreductase
MKYRSLAGLDVSVLALGAASFGGIGSSRKLVGKGETEAEAHALLDCALAHGINLIDTAGTYGAGASEDIIGSWLASRGSSVREKILISSKVGIRGGLGRANVQQEIDRTLARLRVDRIDLYLTHLPDPTTAWEDVLVTMRDLVRTGKIRAFGISNVSVHDVDACARAASDGGQPFEWVQNMFNLLDRNDLHNGVIDACLSCGMKYTPYSPLAGGLLSGKYVFADAIPEGTRVALRPDMYGHAWTAANSARIESLKAKAAALSMSAAGLATWWVANCEFVASVIVGPRRPEQLERMVLEALELPEDRELWQSLARLETAEEVPCNSK